MGGVPLALVLVWIFDSNQDQTPVGSTVCCCPALPQFRWNTEDGMTASMGPWVQMKIFISDFFLNLDKKDRSNFSVSNLSR